MSVSVQGLAAALQTLLTDVAEEAAKASGFIRRRRKITGAGFVQSLVLGWMADPRAKLEDLAATLGVADQSLDERFNDRAVDCLKRVLNAALGFLFEARPETIPLLRRFTAVALDDSTSLTLPASLAQEYPGCGGSDDAGAAGMKVMARLEAIAGRLEFCEPAPASASDRTLHKELPPLPSGSLRLADLGFFDLDRMAADTAAGVSWISRAPSRLKVRHGDEPARNLPEWLGSRRSDRIDAIVTVGTKTRLTCRLVAVRARRTWCDDGWRTWRRSSGRSSVPSARRSGCSASGRCCSPTCSTPSATRRSSSGSSTGSDGRWSSCSSGGRAAAAWGRRAAAGGTGSCASRWRSSSGS